MKKIITTLKADWPRFTLDLLVVVLGITIAFTLESWAEKRKERQVREEYVRLAYYELIDDMALLDENIRYYQHSDSIASVYLESLLYESYKDDDSAHHTLAGLASLSLFVPSFNAYESLKSFGGMNILDNHQMVKKYNEIISYYHGEMKEQGQILKEIVMKEWLTGPLLENFNLSSGHFRDEEVLYSLKFFNMLTLNKGLRVNYLQMLRQYKEKSGQLLELYHTEWPKLKDV